MRTSVTWLNDYLSPPASAEEQAELLTNAGFPLDGKDTAENGERRVRIAFLTTLNREPTPDEATSWRKQIAIQGDAVIKDLVWVLCNSNEFRFLR